MEEDRSVSTKYRTLVAAFGRLRGSTALPNSHQYQSQLWDLIQQFSVLNRIVLALDLYSENETLDEINVNYLPFVNVDYYLAELYLNYLYEQAPTAEKPALDFKEHNLKVARNYYTDFLDNVDAFGIFSGTQRQQYQQGYQLSREEKIEAYKKEKALASALENVDPSTDEDAKRQVYIDEIRLYAMKSLSSLQLLNMELQVLANRPKTDSGEHNQEADARAKGRARVESYTTRLETIPKNQKINDVISNGKVLQPFTFTRQELKGKLFGTGQELPSMTVDEYLDYELKNGKMAKPEEPRPEDRDTDDEEEEIRKREWDDWKDANPKGSGNTGANLG